MYVFFRQLADFRFAGLFEPAAIFAAFFSKIAAGGDLVMNVNDLSL